MWFNDYWNGAYEKPAAFVQRLDEAEDYLNELNSDRRVLATRHSYSGNARLATSIEFTPLTKKHPAGR
jgi:hypothetical protein